MKNTEAKLPCYKHNPLCELTPEIQAAVNSIRTAWIDTHNPVKCLHTQYQVDLMLGALQSAEAMIRRCYVGAGSIAAVRHLIRWHEAVEEIDSDYFQLCSIEDKVLESRK